MELGIGAKILVVDDEPINRDILANLLMQEGYDVLCEKNGENALQAMPGYEPDLVLLDIMMPGIDGFEVTRRLKSSPEFQYIPVVLQTALDDRESCRRGLELGAEDYITKPIDAIELLARIRNLLRLKRLNDLLTHNNRILTDYDSLTGLPNQKLFTQLLKKTVEDNQATTSDAGLILISTRNFTDISKIHGAALGDLILQEMAKRLLHTRDKQTEPCHINNDLFAAIVNGPELSVVRYAKQIQSEFKKPFIVDNQEVFISSRMGLALYPVDGSDWETLYRHAEMALDNAKQVGTNTYRFFLPTMDLMTIERVTLEQDLHRALQNNDFILHYQPQVDLFNGEIKSTEALIRWQHPRLGFIPPGEFVPLAEEYGLIIPITQWVLNTACEQNKRWQSMGLPNLTIAVNISSHHFQNGQLLLNVSEALQASGLSAEYLELEITEGVMLEDSDRVMATLKKLKELGVQLSIDDFGTGYSSLSYLQRLDVDRIKIDQSFVNNITTNPGNAVIARSIINMSHQFDFHVIAEGVETEAQLCFLLRHHCDEIQGYYFSRPLPADELEKQLREGRRLFVENMQPDVHKRTLLIVDDEFNITSALNRILRREGYHILLATSGEDGLELLAKHNVRVVLSDQRMPGMSGSEFLMRVKDLYPDTVRILLTGYTELDCAVKAINDGMIYKFYTKPWDDHQLRENIRDAFRHQEMARDLMQLRLKLHKAESQ